MDSYKVEVVMQNSCRTTGEGPHWQASMNALLYVDIEAGFLHRWHPQTKLKHAIQIDGMVSAVVPCKDSGYIIAKDLSLARLDWQTKHMHTLHTVEKDQSNRFNDAKCDASGRLWAGTMPLNNDGNAMALPRNRGSLYSLECDGTLVQRLPNISLSNGLAWNKANDTMYYIDSLPKKLYAFDFDLSTGKITRHRTVYECQEDAFPDGMCIDSEDKLWVAFFGLGQIRRIDPASGSVIQTVTIPGALTTTSCCFGGSDYSDLYVTSCALGIKPETKDQNTCAGSVFRVTGLGVKGLPPYEYGQ